MFYMEAVDFEDVFVSRWIMNPEYVNCPVNKPNSSQRGGGGIHNEIDVNMSDSHTLDCFSSHWPQYIFKSPIELVDLYTANQNV